MKLYHGTSETTARAVLREGAICPRAALHDSAGNWTHSVDSDPDAVYMTTAYAPYFAMAACSNGAQPRDERWAIIEIDTDELDTERLRPDEDYLEQATRSLDDKVASGECALPGGWADSGYVTGLDMEARTIWFRERSWLFAHLWRSSLDALGNCAHSGGIDIDAIARVVLFDPMANPVVAQSVFDPSISIINYHVLGEHYRARTRWMFEAVTLAEFDPFLVAEADAPRGTRGHADEVFVEQFNRRTCTMRDAVADRRALEIIHDATNRTN